MAGLIGCTGSSMQARFAETHEKMSLKVATVTSVGPVTVRLGVAPQVVAAFQMSIVSAVVPSLNGEP